MILQLAQTIAPGNSTGTLSSGTIPFATGGTFEFQLNDAAGTAGSTTAVWDLLSPTGLNITAGVGQFHLNIFSLTSLQATGSAQNFVDGNNYSWMFVNAGSAITGFNANQFSLDTTGFSNTFTGTFSVAKGTGGTANDLFINYTAAAVPEPSTYAIPGLGLAGLWSMRRKRI
jgi:hypothetical protein